MTPRPRLTGNDIYNNISFGVYNDPPTTPIVIAENHWWGSPDGPTPGVDVSEGVDYEPWAEQSCTGTDPRNLVATAVSTNQIDLVWQDNSSDESEFHIERSPNGSTNWTEISIVGADVTSYSNTGLTSGTTYYYRVCAYRQSDNKCSPYSNVASATTFVHTVYLPAVLK